MFMADLPEYATKIHEHYTQKEYESLHQMVHKLHGATCYCGMTRLKSLLSQFESALKAEQTKTYDELYTALDEEINAIHTYYRTHEFEDPA